jgi:hypothetical protein
VGRLAPRLATVARISLKMHTIDLALFAPPTFFRRSYWINAHVQNIFVDHAVFVAFGEVAAAVAVIFISARRMREAKAITRYGFAHPRTTSDIRTLEHAPAFCRQHVEVKDITVQLCPQRRPVRRGAVVFVPKRFAFAPHLITVAGLTSTKVSRTCGRTR